MRLSNALSASAMVIAILSLSVWTPPAQGATELARGGGAKKRLLKANAVNLAKGKPASQSSVGFGGKPNRAVDGNRSQRYESNTTSHTGKNDKMPWWEVDLGAVYKIDLIRIYNRVDCCLERIVGANVILSPQPIPKPNGLRAKSKKVFPLKQKLNEFHIAINGFEARYVRVQLPKTGFLHMAEVEVYGDPKSKKVPPPKPKKVVKKKGCDTKLNGKTCVQLTRWKHQQLPDGTKIAMRMRTLDDWSGRMRPNYVKWPYWIGVQGSNKFDAVKNDTVLKSKHLFTVKSYKKVRHIAQFHSPWFILKGKNGKYVRRRKDGSLFADGKETDAHMFSRHWGKPGELRTILGRTWGNAEKHLWQIGQIPNQNLYHCVHPMTFNQNKGVKNWFEGNAMGCGKNGYVDVFIVE